MARRLPVHQVLAIIIVLLFAFIPWGGILALGIIYGFLKYETSEEKKINDSAYKDIREFLIWLVGAGIIVAILWKVGVI